MVSLENAQQSKKTTEFTMEKKESPIAKKATRKLDLAMLKNEYDKPRPIPFKIFPTIVFVNIRVLQLSQS